MTRTLTVGAPTRVIVAFTLPLLIGNLFQQAYQFTDAAVVGRMVGVDALAAVGASGSLVFLLLGFTLGAANGLAIPVARAFGSGDMPAMRRHVALGTLASAAISAVIVLIGLRYTRPMLALMQTPDVLMEDAAAFLMITFAAAPVTMAFNYLAAIIRALGDSRTPLIFLMLACFVNVGLVVLFIGSFGWGVGGAAWATAISQLASVVACLWLIRVRMPQLWLWREDWLPKRGETGESVRPGLAMGFQMSVIAIGAVILQYAINGLGPDAVAAATAAVRVDQVAVAPLASFGLALTTFVAQNRGAGHWRRIRVGVWEISLLTWLVSLLMGGLIYLFGTPVAQVFVGAGNEAVVSLAHDYLVVQAALYPVLASLFVLRNAVQGLGSNLMPTLAGFMELVFRAVAGLLLVGPLGFFGVAIAAPLAWIGAVTPVAIAWFVRRRELIRWEGPDVRTPSPGRVPVLAAT
ncbi:MATE family efflux transporter [Propioniciclava coleopterorum]|uniref:Probable multidrug resistance protein NorM n=1 Tax=Propioniciclava coleopterorum TaxID=2714937 RepID=A0A6G7Y6G9_9ACTN|nr:MATE family efflux transporter [Propioniciclava coleopterorum]QIK72276.1 MATE family efflux transporter [Propioniciclava coleopterorum]